MVGRNIFIVAKSTYNVAKSWVYKIDKSVLINLQPIINTQNVELR